MPWNSSAMKYLFLFVISVVLSFWINYELIEEQKDGLRLLRRGDKIVYPIIERGTHYD